MSLRLNEGLEVRYDLLYDIVPDLKKPIQNVLVGDNLRPLLRERHVQRDLVVHVHFGPSGHVGDATPGAQWCLSLERTSRPVDLHVIDVDALLIPEASASEVGVDTHEGKPAVLVEVGKFPEDPEGVLLPRVATSIRLQSLDRCLGFWMCASDPAAPPVLEFVSGTANGELGQFLHLGGSGRSHIRLSESKSEVVESRPEVVDNVSDHEGQLERRIAEWLGAERAIAGFRVYLLSDSVGIRTNPPMNLSGKGLQVLVCSRDFQDMAERWHAPTSPRIRPRPQASRAASWACGYGTP